MKFQIIRLEPYDDVISIRDRLAFVNTERVVLVWPAKGAILRRKLDLVLIQREAARCGMRLALVTTDPDVIDNAYDLNISTFASVSASQQAAWKRPLNKVFVDRSDRPDNAPDPYELRLAASRLQSLTPQQRRVRYMVRALTGTVLIVVLTAVALLLGPSAEVTLTPAQAQISTTVRLTADSTVSRVDVENGRIPAALMVIEVQTQASIPTTGSADVPNTLANGTVIFTNQTGTPVFIPSGTVVSTSIGQPVQFRTVNDATVEGGVGKTAEVTIEALQSSGGPAGNIEANLIINIEGPLSDAVSVRNPQPTRGGSIRQQALVTRADYDNLLVLTREKIRQTSLAEFSPKLTGTQFIAPDSIKIVEERPEWVAYNAFIGDPADALTLTLRAKVQALVIDEQLARQAALASLAARVPNGQQIIPDSVIFTRGPIQPTDPKGQVGFLMSASANVAVAVNVDRVRQRLAGVSISDAQAILEREWLLDPRRPPQIAVWPAIFGRLPLLPVRINVRVQES
ncbi:MAG: hypothetical protein IT324_05865 [Anaerolineae bacterium]|nr:hypothetical protein [Anaerolineae bacterium]